MTTDRQEELIRENERMRQSMENMLTVLAAVEHLMIMMIDELTQLVKGNTPQD